MKKEYVAPQVEVVKIEIEDAILAMSGDPVENFLKGESWGPEF